METIIAIMNIAVIVFCVYGIIVMNKWHNVAAKLDVLADDFREDINDLLDDMEGDLHE